MAQYDVITSTHYVNKRGVIDLMVPVRGPYGMDTTSMAIEITDMVDVKVCHHSDDGLVVSVKTAGVNADELDAYIKNVRKLIEPKIHRRQCEARHRDLIAKFENPSLFVKLGKKSGTYEVLIGWIPDSVMSRQDRRGLCGDFAEINPVASADLGSRGSKIIVTLKDRKLESNIRADVKRRMGDKLQERLVECLMRDEPFVRG